MPARLKSLIPSSIRHKLILVAITCIVVPAIVSLILYNSLTKEALRQRGGIQRKRCPSAGPRIGDESAFKQNQYRQLYTDEFRVEFLLQAGGLRQRRPGSLPQIYGLQPGTGASRQLDGRRREKLCDRHPGERLLLHELFRKRLQSARLQARPWFSRISESQGLSLYGRSRRPRCSSPTKSIIRRAYRWCARSGRRIPRYTAT